MAEPRDTVSWEEAVQCAARRIRRDGIARLDLDDVGKDLDVRPGAVRYWFSDETDLLISIMQVRQRWFMDQADARLAPLTGHGAKLAELLELCVADHDMTYWIELWKLGRHSAAARRARQEVTGRYRDLFARVIRAGQRTGEFGPVGADHAALVLAGLVTGLSVDATVGDDASAEAMHGALVTAAERLLEVELS